MPDIEHIGQHISDDGLASLLELKLEREETARILAHLDECDACERRLEAIEPAVAEFRERMNRAYAHVSRLAWPDLGPQMARWDAGRRSGAKGLRFSGVARSGAWISAVAAAALIVALLFWPHGVATARAETLLLRAQASVERSTAKGRLRIQTRHASFVRPAVMRTAASVTAEESTVRAEFAAAHYDWADPLNPKSFLAWRRSLTTKSDDVAVENDSATQAPKDYAIRTHTEDCVLKEASLTVGASDFLPVKARFTFADQEWVEVTAIPDAVAEVAAAAMTLPTPAATAAPKLTADLSLAARELRVRLAIDALSDPLGDEVPPVIVDVQPEGRIVVTPYQLSAGQEQQLRAALEGMDGVTVLPAPDGVRAPRGNREQGTAADAIIDGSQAVAAQAHLLAQLDQRFDAAAEAALGGADRKSLTEMRVRHAARMVRDIDLLRRSLEQDRPGFAGFSPASDAAAAAEVSSAAVLDAATTLDRLVTKLYAATDPDKASPQQLAAALARVQQFSRTYARRVGAEAVP